MTSIANATNELADPRWCQGGEGRIVEFGVVGAEQADETSYDQRLSPFVKGFMSEDGTVKRSASMHKMHPSKSNCDEDEDEDEDGSPLGRIRFSERKLYGRENDLLRCQSIYNHDGAAVFFLAGYPGSGKSAFVEKFVELVSGPQSMAQHHYSTYEDCHSNSTALHSMNAPLFLSTKYEEIQSTAAFSALTTIFDNIDEEKASLLARLLSKLHENLGDDALVLQRIFPGLRNLCSEFFINEESSISACGSATVSNNSVSLLAKKDNNKSRLLFALRLFFKEACIVLDQPVVLFLDDLQWADQLSLEFLEALLVDPTLDRLIFFGAYRSNEVNDDHNINGIIDRIEAARTSSLTPQPFVRLELRELSREDVAEFIGDSLELETDETLPLVHAVYSKSLGNPFFTRQALEQLVRKNVLYYDTIRFCWAWNLREQQLKELISDDLMEIIKSKLFHLGDDLQTVLIIASYTRSTFDVDTLLALLHPELERYSEELRMIGNQASSYIPAERSNSSSVWVDYSNKRQRLIGLLDAAVAEGLLENSGIEFGFARGEADNPVSPNSSSETIHKQHASQKDSAFQGKGNFRRSRLSSFRRSRLSSRASTSCALTPYEEYSFAHDRIQEAARCLIMPEEEDDILYEIGIRLYRRAMSPVLGEDWMFFASAQHLNDVQSRGKRNMQSRKAMNNPGNSEMLESITLRRRKGIWSHFIPIPKEDFGDTEMPAGDREMRMNLESGEHKTLLAHLNLRTAELSRDLLAFPEAAKFCIFGMKHLPEEESERWSDQYFDLTLKLYSVGAEAELGSGNIEQAEEYCNRVIGRRNINKDRFGIMKVLPVYKVYLDVLATRAHEVEAEDLVLTLLSELGINFPRENRLQRARAWFVLKRVRSKCISTEASILDMPQVCDPATIEIMNLLHRAGSLVYNSNNVPLYVLICCESMRWMNKFGLTDDSAVSLASFSNILMHVYGDFETAPKIAELAILVADRLQNKFSETRALNTANHNVLGWVRPLQTRQKFHIRAYESGLASGNLDGAMVGKSMSQLVQLFSGMPLKDLEKDFRLAIPEMRRMGLHFTAKLSCIGWQIVLNLLGQRNETEESSIDDDILCKGEAINETTPEGIETYHKTMPLKMFFEGWRPYLYVFFGAYERGAEDALKRGDFYTKNAIGMMYGMETFFRGFSLLAAARNKMTKEHPNSSKYKKEGLKVLKNMKILVKKGCVNLAGPTLLLKAEAAALAKQQNRARSAFENSIVACHEGNFFNFAGLASERFSLYLSEISDENGMKVARSRAIKYYSKWGASRKVEILEAMLSN